METKLTKINSSRNFFLLDNGILNWRPNSINTNDNLSSMCLNVYYYIRNKNCINIFNGEMQVNLNAFVILVNN